MVESLDSDAGESLSVTEDMDQSIRVGSDLLNAQWRSSDLNRLLDLKGCKCTAAAGVRNVVEGTRVVMKGEMVMNLFKLIGDTMPGGTVF